MCRRALLLLLLLVAALPTAVAARSLVIERFDAEVVVTPEGVTYVTETIRPRFTGEWNGIFRTIPVEYRTPQGFNYTLYLDVESVTDDRGNPLKVEQSRRAPLPQIQDLGSGCSRRDPHRRLPLSGFQRPEVLRGARRALLERHRRRVGGPHSERQCSHPAAARG
jgi:hypothetical protein